MVFAKFFEIMCGSSAELLPAGPVTFTAGKTVLGTAQLSGGKAKFTTSTLAVGSTKVTATFSGDSEHFRERGFGHADGATVGPPQTKIWRQNS